jgi:hypothetical protein
MLNLLIKFNTKMTQPAATEDYSKEIAIMREQLRTAHPQKGIFLGTFFFSFGAICAAKAHLGVQLYMCKLYKSF